MLLASTLVNYKGKKDSWFETDWFNKHHNLVFKLLLQNCRRTSSDITTLFTYISLTASYCLDLQDNLKCVFGEFNSTHHTIANILSDVYNLALELSTNITQRSVIQKSLLQCIDLVKLRAQKLIKLVKEEQATKLILKSILSQLGSSTRKSRILKQPVYYSSLINAFNAKLQGDTGTVKGLDEVNKNESQTTPINTLLNRASLDTWFCGLLCHSGGVFTGEPTSKSSGKSTEEYNTDCNYLGTPFLTTNSCSLTTLLL